MQEMRPDRDDIQGRWEFYAGAKFRLVGRGRYEFPSKSSPGTSYICDLEERTCSCWSHTRPRSTVPCIHFRLILAWIKKQHTTMKQPDSSPSNPEVGSTPVLDDKEAPARQGTAGKGDL